MDSPLGKEFASFKKKVIIAITVVSIGCAVGIYQSRTAGEDAQSAATEANNALIAFEKESKQRRDQSCDITEKAQLKAVTDLRNTYKYIESLRPKEVRSTLNQFIIASMSKTYSDAATTVAPKYCDQPGIGLPEPNPVLPPKRSFSNLIVVK